jgi:hypothetical protein
MMADSHETVARWRDFEHAGWQEAAARYHDWLGGGRRCPLLSRCWTPSEWRRAGSAPNL